MSKHSAVPSTAAIDWQVVDIHHTLLSNECIILNDDKYTHVLNIFEDTPAVLN